MVPAAIVARELDIRIIETVSVIGYHADDSKPQQANETKIVKQPANVGDGEGWLVIDDLVDTGRTVDVLRRLLPKAHFAAIYAKPLGRPLVEPSLPRSARIPGFTSHGMWSCNLRNLSSINAKIAEEFCQNQQSSVCSRSATSVCSVVTHGSIPMKSSWTALPKLLNPEPSSNSARMINVYRQRQFQSP